MDHPYLGQVLVSNQQVLFVYLGEGYYINTVQRNIVDPDHATALGLAPLRSGSEYRLYEVNR